MDTSTIPQTSTAPAFFDNQLQMGGSERHAVCRRAWLFIVMLATPLALFLLLLTPAAQASDCMNVVVTRATDGGAGSLRQALVDVCAGGKITFASALTAGGPVTITLTNNELYIRKHVTIVGPGADLLAVSGDNRNRVFFISYQVTADISGLTIRDGVDFPDYQDGKGGGILLHGDLTLRASKVVSNAATYGGGSTYGVSFALLDVTFAQNLGIGGGIYNGGVLSMVNSSMIGNFGLYGMASGLHTTAGTAVISNTTVMSNGVCNGTTCPRSGSPISSNGGVRLPLSTLLLRAIPPNYMVVA
ncbi:MAG: hypothetical protein IPK16_27240 [Anaerolineales bacterium]|nr:hypothetical protein [Anaerolineales bacterium]